MGPRRRLATTKEPCRLDDGSVLDKDQRHHFSLTTRQLSNGVPHLVGLLGHNQNDRVACAVAGLDEESTPPRTRPIHQTPTQPRLRLVQLDEVIPVALRL